MLPERVCRTLTRSAREVYAVRENGLSGPVPALELPDPSLERADLFLARLDRALELADARVDLLDRAGGRPGEEHDPRRHEDGLLLERGQLLERALRVD